MNSPELRQTVREAPAVLAQLRQTLATMDREVAALSRTGQRAVGDSAMALQKTLSSVQALVATIDRESAITLTAIRGTLGRADGPLDNTRLLLDPQGPMVSQLQQTVDDLAATAARLRNVAERVDRDPAVLVRGRESKHRLSWLSTALIAIVLAACASSPPTLVALPAATAPGPRQVPDAAVVVRLRHVHVPDYLDGFAVVIGRDSHVLVVANRTEWAERPSQGVSRVLRDALSQRLGSSRVLIAGDGRRADADLSVELVALDPARDALT
ncbi:MAG TPA: ABC-type transport auxiliary lipoprotein family protein, partial [Burkholderiaceae bacterium]|nr:ABC-type transport auxiliary lipoprotein family protein [Burkholderiaceae bacterium]